MWRRSGSGGVALVVAGMLGACSATPGMLDEALKTDAGGGERADGSGPIAPADLDSGGQATTDGGIGDAAAPRVDASADATGAIDAGVDASAMRDAGVDSAAPAPLDAGEDASTDGALIDASDDGAASVDATPDVGTDAGVDAGVDAGLCSSGDTRCYDYMHERCDGTGTWQRDFSQVCCTDPARFVPHSDGTTSDLLTGLTWTRGDIVGTASSVPFLYCENDLVVGAPAAAWRTPSLSELLGIVIGPADSRNIAVCEPAIDQKAFVMQSSTDTVMTADANTCVWFAGGETVTCDPMMHAALCVH